MKSKQKMKYFIVLQIIDQYFWVDKTFTPQLTLSNISNLLVEARRTTPSLLKIPSISTSNWFKVCSDSWEPPSRLPPEDRLRPMASNSSI